MGKPSAPTPPNPYVTAAAQTGTNVSTGVANAFLNNINQNTPDGSLNYDVSGSHSWQDPSTGHTYNIPRFTATQTLTPQGQQLQNTNNLTKQAMATMGLNQANRASDLLSTPFNPSWGAPAGGDTNWLHNTGYAQTGYDSGGAIQSTFGDAGQITRDYGPADGFSADRLRVEDALMQRMNPQLARERSGIEQRMADQGIRYGSAAYTSAMDDYNRQANDARFAAVGAGGQEQQRMMDMAAQRAGFQNAAQQQSYDQEQGRGTFANMAQNQRNNQNASQAGFYNAGTAQNLARNQSIFNAANTQRNQYMQEQYAQRNQPLNEISALLGGSAVQSPNFINSANSQIATTDIGGLINQNFQQNQANYQTANSNWQSMMGGILGLGAGALKLSDRREKENVTRVGSVLSAGGGDGPAPGSVIGGSELPIYEYSYKKDPASTRHVGPMAQDVEKIDRGAVHNIGGRKVIDTSRVMGGILRAA